MKNRRMQCLFILGLVLSSLGSAATAQTYTVSARVKRLRTFIST
jgi:hypothetical protein